VSFSPLDNWRVLQVPHYPHEIANRLIEAHGEEALYEAESLAVLHYGHAGEWLYAEVLSEVRRRLAAVRPCVLLPAG
jgi:hypothetical protein